MANTNGNVYPVWYINHDSQVFAFTATRQAIPRSDPGFAADLCISEDGIVWVLSHIPHPHGGGSKIFWSTGDGCWNEIKTSDPGGMKIAGVGPGGCYYLTTNYHLRSLNTQGISKTVFQGHQITAFDVGHGFCWALFPTKPGGLPILQFGSFGVSPFQWHTFAGNPTPRSLSVDHFGHCYGILHHSPVYFNRDGITTQSVGKGADGISLEISAKSHYYILTKHADKTGNQILINDNGTFVDAGFRANKVAASWYVK